MSNKCEVELSLQKHGDTWWLCSESEYPESSVLAGEYRFTKLDPYDSLEEAVAANPNVKVRSDVSLPSWIFQRALDTIPEWFDPSDCNEQW